MNEQFDLVVLTLELQVQKCVSVAATMVGNCRDIEWKINTL